MEFKSDGFVLIRGVEQGSMSEGLGWIVSIGAAQACI